MSTLAELTERVIANLHGFTRDQEEKTWILSGIDADDLTFRVNDTAFISAGMAEIEEELLWVSRVDKSSGDVTIAPFGRGYQGSTAASHSADACIVNAPKFPRVQVQQAINDAVRGVYPDLYVIGNYEFDYVAARTTYELPSDVDTVRKVTTQTIGPTKRWANLVRWRFNPQADTDSFDTGKSLDIYQEPIAGQAVRVTYTKPPSAFTDTATEFATATGLAATSEDCIVYGACFRLVGLVEAPRLQIAAIEQQLRSQQVQPGASQHAARHFLQMYQLALMSERERLNRLNPSTSHLGYI